MSKKKKQREAELREQERAMMLRQMQEQEAAAQKEEEAKKQQNRPIAMEEYYNIAYAKERKRLNEMFGRINYGYYPDEPTTVEKIVYKEPDMKKFVPMEKYKKKKRTAGFFIFTTILFLLTTAFFALEYFGIIHLLP